MFQLLNFENTKGVFKNTSKDIPFQKIILQRYLWIYWNIYDKTKPRGFMLVASEKGCVIGRVWYLGWIIKNIFFCTDQELKDQAVQFKSWKRLDKRWVCRKARGRDETTAGLGMDSMPRSECRRTHILKESVCVNN